eukprot:scaffold1889_cov176-Alexandrium_tamarense.AAC.1
MANTGIDVLGGVTCDDFFNVISYGCECPDVSLPSDSCGYLCEDGSSVLDPDLVVVGKFCGDIERESLYARNTDSFKCDAFKAYGLECGCNSTTLSSQPSTECFKYEYLYNITVQHFESSIADGGSMFRFTFGENGSVEQMYNSFEHATTNGYFSRIVNGTIQATNNPISTHTEPVDCGVLGALQFISWRILRSLNRRLVISTGRKISTCGEDKEQMLTARVNPRWSRLEAKIGKEVLEYVDHHVIRRGTNPSEYENAIAIDEDQRIKKDWKVIKNCKANSVAYDDLILSIDGLSSTGKVAFNIVETAKSTDYLEGNARLAWLHLANNYAPKTGTSYFQLMRSSVNSKLDLGNGLDYGT